MVSVIRGFMVDGEPRHRLGHCGARSEDDRRRGIRPSACLPMEGSTSMRDRLRRGGWRPTTSAAHGCDALRALLRLLHLSPRFASEGLHPRWIPFGYQFGLEGAYRPARAVSPSAERYALPSNASHGRENSIVKRRFVTTLLATVLASLLASCTADTSSDTSSSLPTRSRHPTPSESNAGSGTPGSEITLACHGNISVAMLGTKAIVRLTTGQKDSAPAFSPDTTSIAFVRHSDVWIMGADGSQQRDLTPVPGYQGDPAWSPDGSQIAYNSGAYESATWGIWIMSADGSNPHFVPNTKGGVQPSWSPDGKTIVFASPPHSWGLYTVSSNGSNLQLLRQPPRRGSRAEDMNPVWSPNGSHIAFTEVAETRPQGLAVQRSAQGGGFPTTYALYAASPDGSNLRRSRQRARLLTFYRPIANVFWIRPDGTGLKRLTNDHGLVSDPTWSPNSKQIAYQRYPGPTLSPPGKGIKIVNVSTHRSTHFIRGGCYQPSWG